MTRISLLFFLAGALAAGSPVSAFQTAEARARMSLDTALLEEGDSRTFEISYVAHVKDVPAGSKVLHLWLPVPQDTPVQKIADLRFDGLIGAGVAWVAVAAPDLRTEKKYGNRVAHWEVKDPPAALDVTMRFTCTRKELVTDLDELSTDAPETAADAAIFLKDDQLTLVNAGIREIAARVTAGKTTTLEKARAIYDHVLNHMTYDKSGEGWGRGDTLRACEVGTGNCTDFHALFISLARASGIPASFEIGLYLPYQRGVKEPPGGYHCWAYFRVPGRTWVPVDVSEADRHAERTSYFFGAQTSNRVTLSVGRDLVLDPPQAGGPLNYFLNPYAEADGKAVTTAKDWDYEDVQ